MTARPAKRQKVDDGANLAEIDLDEVDLEDLDEETIQRLLDQAEDVQEVDLTGLKRLVLNLERVLTRNQQMRIKFASKPEKFVTSEIELDNAIKDFTQIATNPYLYPELVRLKCHETLLSLFQHENTDICIDVITLIRDLTDESVYTNEEDAPDQVSYLVEKMIDNQLLECIIQTIHRFDESQFEDKKGVFATLEIVENIIEIEPLLARSLVEKTSIMKWLLNRLKKPKFEEIKGYCAEILFILLQNSKKNQIEFGASNGINTLLSAIALYQKKNPPSSEEEEMVENLFNCLCNTIVLKENKKYFTEAQGLRLMQKIIKNKRFARKCALKLLSFAMQEDVNNCKRWVEIPGLGTLFAAFMKKGAQKHKKGFSTLEDDEHCMSIIASLFTHLSPEGNLWGRVLAKFAETNFEKIERLIELHDTYVTRVRSADAKISKQRNVLVKQGLELTEEDELDFYMERLDAGLFTLQYVDYVIGIVCSSNEKLKEKCLELLELQGHSLADVISYIKEFASNLGGKDATTAKIELKVTLDTMVAGLSVEDESTKVSGDAMEE